MIRAHVAAPQSGDLRSELQHDDGPGPKTPDTPKTASSAMGAAPTQPAAGNGGTNSCGATLRPEAIAHKRPAEPTVTQLLALARSSGDSSPLAAHRMLEAVSEGALRQTSYSDEAAAATDVALDPMCCVGCGTTMQDLASLGLRRVPQQWEWTCQACLQPKCRSEHPTHTISTPEQ